MPPFKLPRPLSQDNHLSSTLSSTSSRNLSRTKNRQNKVCKMTRAIVTCKPNQNQTHLYAHCSVNFHLKLTYQLESCHLSASAFVYFSPCTWFDQQNCLIPSIPFLSDFERYKDSGICSWNPKQHRRSKKSSNVADSATNLILACCRFRLQFREGTVWPRYVVLSKRQNRNWTIEIKVCMNKKRWNVSFIEIKKRKINYTCRQNWLDTSTEITTKYQVWSGSNLNFAIPASDLQHV